MLNTILVILLLISCFAVVFSRPTNLEMDLNSGILFRCQESSKFFAITKRGAQRSTVLKRILESRGEAITVRAEENCAEGLAILIDIFDGNKFKVNKRNFVQVFPLASQLDIEMVHKPCIKFFAESSPKVQLELISSFNNYTIRKELEDLANFLTRIREISQFKIDVEEILDLNGLELKDVTWLTNALSSGGLRYLKALNLQGNQISAFDISPELPLRLEKLELRSNQLLNADSIVRSLNQDKLPYLTFLDLSYNEISTFTNMKSPSLETLQLSHNRLQNIDSLVPSLNEGKLPNLTHLNVRDNDILSWMAWKKLNNPVPSLRTLTYDFRKIETMKDIKALVHAIQHMPNLVPYDQELVIEAYEKLAKY